MPKPYSEDLRERVLNYLDENNDKHVASRLFQIGITTVYRWVRERRDRGHSRPLQRKYAYRKIDYDSLKKYVEANPDHFLFEIAEHFSVTAPAILYACTQLKITRKKRLRFTKNEAKKKGKSLSKS